jgi:hypothetical protein
MRPLSYRRSGEGTLPAGTPFARCSHAFLRLEEVFRSTHKHATAVLWPHQALMSSIRCSSYIRITVCRSTGLQLILCALIALIMRALTRTAWR